jgi:hypothetical protein
MTDSAEQNDKSPIVIGLVPPSSDAATIEAGISRIVSAVLPMRAVLVHPPYTAVASQPSFEVTGWQFVSQPGLTKDRTILSQSLGQNFRSIFDIAENLGARACAIITSDLSTVSAKWVEQLVNPLISDGFDLVAPCYASHPFDGMLNRGVVYPLVSALYGKRVRNPMGPDFGFSNQLLTRAATVRARPHPLISLVAEAIATEMKICQSYIGARIFPSPDWNNLNPFLSQVLGALFLDVERFAPWWQRARGSQPVAEFGDNEPVSGHAAPPDPALLMRAFQSGTRSLEGIWGTVLPASTLAELQQLALLGPSTFRMADQTWARIVYDFAVAHRIHVKDRAQLMRAFGPLYMGWAASYTLEISDASAAAVEHRIEELCGAFEMMKPYFVSRWRWPDRFNP